MTTQENGKNTLWMKIIVSKFPYSQSYHASHNANSNAFRKVITGKINFLHRGRIYPFLYVFYLHTSIDKNIYYFQ